MKVSQWVRVAAETVTLGSVTVGKLLSLFPRELDQCVSDGDGLDDRVVSLDGDGVFNQVEVIVAAIVVDSEIDRWVNEYVSPTSPARLPSLADQDNDWVAVLVGAVLVCVAGAA